MNNPYYKNLPKKRMAAGALIFNDAHELLIVKPNYKDHWEIPGGVVEENESPCRSMQREVKEEVSIEVKECRLLCVDYTSAKEEKTESLQFIFDSGIISEEHITIENKEIEDYQFASIETALPLFSEGLRKRVMAALSAFEKNSALYTENGEC